VTQCPEYYADNHGADLTDFFASGRSVSDLRDLLARAVVIEKPKEPEISPNVQRFMRGRKFLPARLAQAIMQDLEVVADPETGLIYRWEGRYWSQYDLSYIRQRALQMLGEDGTSSKAADVANMIRDLSVLPPGRAMNDRTDMICLESGMFDLSSGDLGRHDRDFFATHMLPIDFDPENIADCPTWKRCLEQWMGDDETVREAQKFAGYCLTRETRYEKMLILYGPGGDGKSTFMNVLRALIGPENCSHVPMGKLEEQFYLSRLVDKLINMSTEVEQRAMQSMEIKAIVSGDPISAAFKNQDPFDFTPFCKLVYSTNRLPKMLDNSDGFFRKILLIEFSGQFVKRGEADIFLMDKLIEELPGIFAWALAGLVMLREEGFTESDAMQKSLCDYKRINNNVLYYIEQHVEIDPAGKAIKSEVYEDYAKRCRAWNLMPLGEPQFRLEFLRLLRERDCDVRDGKAYDESQVRRNAYTGLRLVDEKLLDDDLPPTPPSPRSDHSEVSQ